MQLCNSLHKSSLDFSKISANLKKAKTSDGLGLFQGAAYGTFRLKFHHFDHFELDPRGDIHVRGTAFSCLRLKLADIVLI